MYEDLNRAHQFLFRHFLYSLYFSTLYSLLVFRFLCNCFFTFILFFSPLIRYSVILCKSTCKRCINKQKYIISHMYYPETDTNGRMVEWKINMSKGEFLISINHHSNSSYIRIINLPTDIAFKELLFLLRLLVFNSLLSSRVPIMADGFSN